jgi:phosphoribosylformylglycinamidine cyclo-ligase
MSSYSDTGVNIQKNDSFIDAIKGICKSTFSKNVYNEIGGFCSLYRIPQLPSLLIAASTDGVGTKVLLASQLNNVYTIGIDLVGMVVNDIITTGATPLFLLDYYGLSSLNDDPSFTRSKQLIEGIAIGCNLANCSLIGGEVSEMKDMYASDKFDVVGFGIGLVEEASVLGSHLVKPGDHIVGIASSGPHSNGYSLIRHVYKDINLVDDLVLASKLLTPTTIYAKLIASLLSHANHGIHAMAHITGGGLELNTKRVVPTSIDINWSSWIRPAIFDTIQKLGNIPEDEMRRVFNCGIGYTLIVDPTRSNRLINRIAGLGYMARNIGTVE